MDENFEKRYNELKVLLEEIHDLGAESLRLRHFGADHSDYDKNADEKIKKAEDILGEKIRRGYYPGNSLVEIYIKKFIEKHQGEKIC